MPKKAVPRAADGSALFQVRFAAGAESVKVQRLVVRPRLLFQCRGMQFSDAALRGVFGRHDVYAGIIDGTASLVSGDGLH